MGGMIDLVLGRAAQIRPKPFMNADIQGAAIAGINPLNSPVSRLDAGKFLLGYLQYFGQNAFICEVSQMRGLSLTPEAQDGRCHPSRA
jgi:hypothetical protein